MTRQLRIVAGAVCLAIAGTATPVVADVPITINGGIGYWVFDDKLGVDETTTPWVSLEWAFSDAWALEGFYAEDQAKYKAVPLGGTEALLGQKADVRTWAVDVLRYWGTYKDSANRVRPYVGLGLGEIELEASTFDDVQSTANAAVGIRWMFGSRFGLRAETRVVHTLDNNQTNALFNVGLNYFFGDVTPDVPAAAAAAAAVAAAPMDSDGDGVNDDADQCPGTPAGTRVDALGCPLPVAQVASIKLTVNFPFDSVAVGEQYFADVGELAAFLQRFDDLQVDVEGHTDNMGPATYNKQLSQRRAQAVVDLLVSEHGIDAARLKAIGYGEERPVASNDTREGRAQNRRVMATLKVEYME